MSDLKSQVEAAIMARKGKQQGNEVKFQCPAHDDANPSAQYNVEKACWHCFVCGESGNYWHLARLLGLVNNGHRPDGYRETRRWDIGGVATHKRLDKEGSKKLVEWERDGKPTLGGLKTESLPLYGHITSLEDDLLINEGEKKTDALLALGFSALGTVTGALGVPSRDALKSLSEHKGRVILFPDNDQAGRDHMTKLAARLKAMGKVVFIGTWPGVPEKGDAYDYVKAEHTAEDVKVVIASAEEYEGEAEAVGLPEIHVGDRQLRDITAEALTALYQANKPERIFHRGGALTRINTDERGRPFAEAINESALRGYLARSCNFMRGTSKGNLVDVSPPLDVVRDIASLDAWDFPPLAAIAESPILRPDGSILDVEGYDPMTRLYYRPPSDYLNVPIPATPSREDVNSAVSLLGEVFCDFAFDGAASQANVLAALISPIVRPLVTGPTPICVIDKTQVGSGATLIATVISWITTGRPATMMNAPRDPDEWRKTIVSVLLQGRGIVILDNVDGSLYDANLAAVLTATSYSARQLGGLECKDLPNLATWLATGNNVQLGGDLPRRAYLVHIDVGMAQPWLRDISTFKHPELEAWASSNRGRILAAILTLARAWIVSGRPYPSDLPRLGGYESWVRVVGGVLANAGIKGFLGNLGQMYERNDAETPAWSAFVTAWHGKFEDRGVTGAEILAALADDKEFEAVLPIDPPRRDKRSGELEDAGFTRRLGKALATRNGRIYPGDNGTEFKLQKTGKSHSAQKWQVVRKGEFGWDKLPCFEAKGELGEFVTPSNAQSPNPKNNDIKVGGELNSPNSPFVANSCVTTKLPYPTKPCLCGSTDFWLRGNERLCAVCHPEPVKEGGQYGHTSGR